MPPVEDAPSAPANLAFQVSGTTVILTWSPPGGGGAVATYVLEAGTAAGQSNIITFATGGTATTFTATSVPEATYFVRVRARNADGTSGPSNEVTIVVGAPGPGPGPGPGPNPTPPGCVPATTDLTGGATGNLLVLRWTSIGAAALSWIVEAGTTPGAANLGSFDTRSPTSSFTTTVPPGTYYIRVYTRAACGISRASNEIVVTVTGGPAGPTATGRWVGTSPEGMIADGGQIHCPIEIDLTMDLTVIGGSVSGTAVLRIRRMQFDACPPLSTLTYHVSGTSGADGSVSMQFGVGSGAYTVTGTVSGTRMTGRWTQAQTGQRGSFTVNRQ